MSIPKVPKEVCFIVGSPRSGSTWLQRLLTSHPEICGGEESYFFSLFGEFGESTRIHNSSFPVGPFCYVNEEQLAVGIRGLWDHIFKDLYNNNPECSIHLEKTPSHGLFVDEIIKVFPNAKIILLTRDSRAVTASMVAASKSWGRHWAPDNYRDAAILWWRHINSVMSWHEKNPNHPFLMLRYEDALDDVETTLQKVLEFIFPDRENLQIDETLDLYQINTTKKNDPVGFSRIRGKDGWKEDMSLYGKLITWRFTRKMMKKLGYSTKVFS